MKAEHVLLSVATLILFACNSTPPETDHTATPATTTVAPVDTVINRYQRKEVAQIERDTTTVADTALVKTP